MNCLTEFVLVHPEGSSETSESYAFRFLRNAPRVGEEYEIGDPCGIGGAVRQWVVARTYSYYVSPSTPGATESVEVAVCTPDGSSPALEMLDARPLTMYLPVSVDGAIASNPDGSNRFGIVENAVNIPFDSLFEDWTLKHCQAFEPVGELAPPGFNQIVLCWCNAGKVAHGEADTERVAA